MTQLFRESGARRVESVELETGDMATQARFSFYEELLANPPTWLRDRFRDADPAGDAVVYAGSFSGMSEVLERPVMGGRTRQQFDVERKDAQASLLEKVGVVASVAPAAALQLLEHRGDQGLTTVLQGVPMNQLAMGSSHTFIVTPSIGASVLENIIADLGRDSRIILVKDFHSGLPCTFYGFVTASHVIDFGPFEALVYWHRNTCRVDAPGVVRPVDFDTETLAACRATVRSLARRLHRKTGYVGAFGTDGVVLGSRYVVHEINPRVCAGFALLDDMCNVAVPLAAADLVLRMQPREASRSILSNLDALASHISSDMSPRLRLWEAVNREIEERTQQYTYGASSEGEWLARVRRSLSGLDEDMVHVSKLHPS